MDEFQLKALFFVIAPVLVGDDTIILGVPIKRAAASNRSLPFWCVPVTTNNGRQAACRSAPESRVRSYNCVSNLPVVNISVSLSLSVAAFAGLPRPGSAAFSNLIYLFTPAGLKIIANEAVDALRTECSFDWGFNSMVQLSISHIE